jgi:hypothetical protein
LRALIIGWLVCGWIWAAPKKTGKPGGREELRVTATAPAEASREAFRVKVDGKEAPLVGVRGPGEDLILFVVLDLSGEPTLVDTAKQALAAQLAEALVNHWVTVLKAQDVLRVLVDPTADREAVRTAIESYPAAGKAGLLNTVETVQRMADRVANRAGVRTAVLYVTDANVYNYREDYTNPVINRSDQRDLSRKFPDELIREQMQKLSARLARYETPLYVVQINFLPDVINETYRRGVLQLAAESGGEGVFCRSRAEIAEEIARVWKAAAGHWELRVKYEGDHRRPATVDVYHGEQDIPNRARFTFGK